MILLIKKIYRLYMVTFSGKVDNFSFQAGLRGEYMYYKTESRPWNVQSPDRTREYWHLYPSLFCHTVCLRGMNCSSIIPVG